MSLTSEKIKPTIKIKINRSIPLSVVYQWFTNSKTFYNYCSTVKRLNKHLGLEVDFVHYDEYNRHADDIVAYLTETCKCANTFRSQLCAISSMMDRAVDDKKNPNLITEKTRKLKIVRTMPKKTLTPDWLDDVLPKLIGASRSPDNKLCQIIATIFKYGFVFRCNVLFETVLVEDMDYHFMDLENQIFHVRRRLRPELHIKMPEFLCIELKELTKTHRKFLLQKSNSKPYCNSSGNLGYHHWNIYNNALIRDSWKEYLNSDITKTSQEKELELRNLCFAIKYKGNPNL